MSYYVKVKVPDHPYADKRGYYPAHRLVAEIYLGRCLKPQEDVHHDNEVKSDNRIENLIVFEDHEAHMVYHRRKAARHRPNSTLECYFGANVSNRDMGIVLYGPACAKMKQARLRALVDKTKRDLKIS